MDTASEWSCTLFLRGGAEVDAAPYAQASASVAIRRPQQFKTDPGEAFDWQLTQAGRVLARGSARAGDRGLAVVERLTIPRDPQRVRLTMTRGRR